MSSALILTLLELTGYALQDIIDLKDSGDAVSYSALIGDSIKKYGESRNADLSIFVDKLTPEMISKVKATVSNKLANALKKKQTVLQSDVEADLAKFFEEESNDDDFAVLCSDLIVGLRSYSNDKSGYLESTDRERKEERQRGRLQDLGVF